MPTQIPTVALNSGAALPQVGFGVFQVPPDETAAAVTAALAAGYRSIDTAALYENEEGVGDAIAASGIPRDELFVTTKLWNDKQGRDRAPREFADSLTRLGLGYVDLYLIHWPCPAQDLYVETWQVFESFQADGRARSIGVSNFQPAHLERLRAASDVVPAVNQVELHPRLQQAEVRAYGAEHGIVTEAWSPLAQGGVLDDPSIVAIAEGHARTAAQIVLRWHLQLGNVVIPKSVTPSRIRENLALFDFELSSDEMRMIAELDAGQRTGPDPDRFG